MKLASPLSLSMQGRKQKKMISHPSSSFETISNSPQNDLSILIFVLGVELIFWSDRFDRPADVLERGNATFHVPFVQRRFCRGNALSLIEIRTDKARTAKGVEIAL